MSKNSGSKKYFWKIVKLYNNFITEQLLLHV